MNSVFLIGRLTSIPELRYTPTNIAVCKISIAINRPKREDGTHETDFIDVIIWRNQAENVCKYLDKGSLVSIEGKLQTHNYEDKEGKKRHSMEVVATNVQFLEPKKKEEVKTEVQQEEDPFADFGKQVEMDDFLA